MDSFETQNPKEISADELYEMIDDAIKEKIPGGELKTIDQRACLVPFVARAISVSGKELSPEAQTEWTNFRSLPDVYAQAGT